MASVKRAENKVRADVVAGFAVAIMLVLSMAYLAPRPDQPVAVMVWPWQSPALASEIVGRSQGYLTDGARFPTIVMAQSNDPKFVRRLYAAGAVIVVYPGFGVGCLVKET